MKKAEIQLPLEILDGAEVGADVYELIVRDCAELCLGKVRREAGYGGQWEGYGPWMGTMNGEECAIAILKRYGLAKSKPTA